MNFKAKDRVYLLDGNIRNRVKAGWDEMLKPAKQRILNPDVRSFLYSINKAESELENFGETLVGKNILEVGCNEGARAYLMARYQDTRVHGIDVDEYTVDQSPDLNAYNPRDVEFVHNTFNEVRKKLSYKVPKSVSNKVTFETCSIEDYKTDNPYDVIISWDTIEHVIDLPKAFQVMASSLKKDGISYHEYNPFFAINGGHSLCTLDFYYGHCRLSKEDFTRYIQEMRPQEEKIDLNFYNKCLNRATRADVKKYAEAAGFEVLFFGGVPTFGKDTPMWREKIEEEIIKEVQENYPTATTIDLLCDFLQIVLKKK